MSAEEKKVIEYVSHLSTSTNPYLEVVMLVDNLVKTPPSPKWSLTLQKVIIGAFVIMLLQAILLLYQRIKTGNFCQLKANKLGLPVIDVSDASAVTYCLYTTLTIMDLALRQAIEAGSPDSSAQIFIFGYKFLAIMACSWAFLWVCACQCVSLMFERISPNFNRARLQIWAQWGMGTFFGMLFLLPFPGVLWAYALVWHEYNQMLAIVAGIRTSLRLAASHYDPQTYNQMSLLRILIPARRLIPHNLRMEKYVRIGVTIYFVALAFLTLTHIPLLTFSLRGLYKRSVSNAAMEAALGKRQVLKQSPTTRRLHRQRSRLVHHALALYTSTAIHIPVIVWQLANSSTGFLKDETWNTVTVLGLHGPFPVTGNIVLLILNLHSRNVLRNIRERRLATHSPSLTPGGTVPSSVSCNKAGNHISAGPVPRESDELELGHFSEKNEGNGLVEDKEPDTKFNDQNTQLSHMVISGKSNFDTLFIQYVSRDPQSNQPN